MTYPHAAVTAELGQHWLDARLDVTRAPDAAALFGVAAIPTAVAVTATGLVRGRMHGLVEPDALRQQLAQIRAQR